MTDLLEMLNESIVSAAFERNEITDMRLAERLIWERKSAAARILELEAALKPFADNAKYFDNCPSCTDEDSPVESFNTFGDFRAARAALEKDK